MKRITPTFPRLLEKIRIEEDCWVFTAHLHHGYGVIRHQGRVAQAHRVMYELLVGEIPDWLDLDHLCRNRACVNPAHLDPCSRAENILRGAGAGARNARKTHCPKGHEYTAETTYVTRTKSGTGKKCRTCALEYARNQPHNFCSATRKARRERAKLALARGAQTAS